MNDRNPHSFSLTMLSRVSILLAFALTPHALAQQHELPPLEVPVFNGRIVQTFQTEDARQAVAVDGDAFYAVNNYSITRHNKETGTAELQWDGISDTDGPLVHLDSGMIHEGLLYAAHSNYPIWPMTSSIEVWDAQSMKHVATHSFGQFLGSMTWLDRYAGFWWGGFGNYDKVQDGQDHAYGETRHTKVVKMNEQFQVMEQWSLPLDLLPRLRPMTNSGGSWGADGHLYLTGHDYPEIYVMGIPKTGSTLEWLATVIVPNLNGQGIAWDRSEETTKNILWGILKQDELVYAIEIPEILALPQKSQAIIRTLHTGN